MKLNYQEFKDIYNIHLNKQQESAVQALKGPVLLLAVPGSGKTTVLVTRLAYMVFAASISPESILTVTYTVAATKDMRERFKVKFGEEMAERLEFRTINGISQKILQYFGRIKGKEPFGIADKEVSSVLKNVFLTVTGQYPTENDIKNLQTGITYVKNMRLTGKEIEEVEMEIKNFPTMYKAYNKELRERRLIDYDDQMVYALQILENYPEVLTYFQSKYQFICVDEAQDTSKIQHDIINILASKYENIFMVGDEDQSIYGFRAAYPEALVNFDKTYRNARILLMEENYRCSEDIVLLSNELICHNDKRHPKKMRANRRYRREVVEIKTTNRKGQYYYLSKLASKCDKQTAVLYRNHESALPLIDILERKGLSFQMKQSDSTFFSHPVVCDIKDFIRLSMNPANGEAFLRIYYKMAAGIKKEIALEAVRMSNNSVPILSVISSHMEISSYTRKQCLSLSTHLKNIRSENAGKAIYKICNFMGYGMYMEEHNMDASKADILRFLGEQEENLMFFLKRLDYLQQIMQEGWGDYDSNLILSTIHSSKGLEYDRVYLLDMIDGILPGISEDNKRKKEKDRAQYEEERRLFYVAMTRAKNELNIFTFQTEKASQFTKEVLEAKKKCFGEQLKRLEQFEEGMAVRHSRYGQGVIVKRMGDYADILFDKEADIIKISLPFAVAKGILSEI